MGQLHASPELGHPLEHLHFPTGYKIWGDKCTTNGVFITQVAVKCGPAQPHRTLARRHFACYHCQCYTAQSHIQGGRERHIGFGAAVE
jgi:hypothetical protein